ncbi:hypothetical protein G6F50_017693 [Rhizopus delemar]|uniref:Uncharacterized protein n=1 Tax=Rhizopus delemar TaxID=936053 RepID=A0A9P6XPA7_9FUNG|nr:hypothetical protein G6F50_017693 [Rhizopus delemar]
MPVPGTPWEMTSYNDSGVRCAARVASVNAIGGGLNACAAGPSPCPVGPCQAARCWLELDAAWEGCGALAGTAPIG